MKKITLIMLSFVMYNVSAQNYKDALRYSTEDLDGTARFKGMSGAFGAIGGDFSAISINPAGSSVFSGGQIGGTLGSNVTKNTITYNGTQVKNRDTDFNLNQFGAVFPIPISTSGWKKISFGFNYQNTKNFDASNFSFSGKSDQNLGDYFKYYADGIQQQDLLLETYQNKVVVDRNTLQDIYFNMGRAGGNRAYTLRNALLGHYVGLIRPHIGRDEIKTTDSDAVANAILQETQYDKNVSDGANQNFERVTSGGVTRYNFNFSTQYDDFLYLGLNLNAHRINQKDKLSHWETYGSTSTITNAYFENEFLTKGSGFSFQLGAIVKATKDLRLGVTYTSPTWYTFNQEYTQYLSTNNRTSFADPRVIVTLPDYKFRTPGSWTASAAYLFSKYAIVSVDYIYKDYKNLHFRSAAKNSENDIIEKQLGETSTVRIGTEFRIPIKTKETANYVSLRAGYRYEQSPYRMKVAPIGDLNGYSFGAGVTLGGIRLDASYDIAKQTNLYQMYETVLTDNAQIKSTYGNFLFTFTAQLF
jgi:putative membrane protein